MTAAITSPASIPSLPIPIYQPSASVPRYLLYSIDHITYLRSHHAILGVLIGTLPQIPQQSVFLGLPLELQPEEAQLLVDKGICYVVNDREWHDGDFRRKCGPERRQILERLRKEGLEIARGVRGMKKQRTKQILQEKQEEQKERRRRKSTVKLTEEEQAGKDKGDVEGVEEEEEAEETLFDPPSTPAERKAPRSRSNSAQERNRSRSNSDSEPKPWAGTPTTTSEIANHHPDPPSTPSTSRALLPTSKTSVNPHTYPLFAHLHAQNYYLSPGLRFGCHFSVYPGDPLRFHSHFLANAYGWDEEIELLELVGGGRLGTGVKKGWLIGGVEEKDGGGEEEVGQVRTFCVEWGGM